MISNSRLAKQLTEVAVTLEQSSVRWALIGGLALAPHKVVRATQDIDVLVDFDRADVVDAAMKKLSYADIHRSSESATYIRGDERVDFLYASRPIAQRLLANAIDTATSFGKLRFVSAEGLIGFKLQGVVNNPRRTQDIEDIRALLRANRNTLNLAEVREYFRLFNREPLFDELFKESN